MIRFRFFGLACVLLGVSALAPRPAIAAQSYDGCAGFIDSVPATITTQGVWCLRKDLSTNITTGAAITVATNNVTIDCNDFKLGGLAAGPASEARGVYAEVRQNTTVRNCNIRGFLIGIQLYGGAGHLVQDNRLDNNLQIGIAAGGENNMIRRNLVYDTGGSTYFTTHGIIATGADIIDNTITNVWNHNGTRVWGIELGAGSAGSVGNVIRNNRIFGLVPNATSGSSGEVNGITAILSNVRITDNHIAVQPARTNASDRGIRAAINGGVCGGNTVIGLSTPRSGCTNLADNQY